MRWKSMDMNNIERNQLDYILTDVLPVELSEQFSYYYFYEYLVEHTTEIDKIIELIKKKKNDNHIVFSESKNWVTAPLSYTIMKKINTTRLISLLQPLGALQLFLFISAYQKEILNILDKNSCFSIRYHKRNNDLYYKNKNKSVSEYFYDVSGESGKEIIEQTGMYFDIGPYKSLASFTSSEEWFLLNSKYKYFIKTDYKSCFDSIYTHTFNWIVGKDVNDTMNFKNGSVYTAIDRILMNINAKTSNGIVVGPEFSRMVAEILLQTIDCYVYGQLLNKGFRKNENYNIYRFVDDVFIFSDSEELAKTILELYSVAARKFLLSLNESKETKKTVPFVLGGWLTETNLFTNRVVTSLFKTKDEIQSYINECCQGGSEQIEKPYLLKGERLSISKRIIMNQFNELICNHEKDMGTIVSYFLGTILNRVSKNKKKYKIFKNNVASKVVYDLLELVLYAYSFFPNFNNTQRILSIISYIKDEVDIFENKDNLQKLFEKYGFIFEKANLNDIVNLILFCCQAQIEIPYIYEEKMIDCLNEKDDPILWASYLLYSRYSENYYNQIRNIIGENLVEKIDAIVDKKNIYSYREFWWILIFNKSPYITENEQDKINNILLDLQNARSDNMNPGDCAGKIFINYLINSDKQFFQWDINDRDFLRSITFKTRQRSIFRNYKENLPSLNWSSI